MELAIVNLDGDLADDSLVGLLYAREPELEVDLEFVELDDPWFDADVVDESPPLRDGILRQALRFLVRRRRDER